MPSIKFGKIHFHNTPTMGTHRKSGQKQHLGELLQPFFWVRKDPADLADLAHHHCGSFVETLRVSENLLKCFEAPRFLYENIESQNNSSSFAYSFFQLLPSFCEFDRNRVFQIDFRFSISFF